MKSQEAPLVVLPPTGLYGFYCGMFESARGFIPARPALYGKYLSISAAQFTRWMTRAWCKFR